MNYSEAREYLREVNKYGSVLGLDSIKELLKRLGNPQNYLKVVHMAGTNGKGSTMAFLQSILMEAGYLVGRYSSPAVFTYREIIRVNDQMIEKDTLAEIVSIIQKKCDEMTSEGLAHPTPFEIETAMALVYFRKKKCDIVLIECGMGGETDATNVFQKVLCSVITSISLDHTQFLGETISEIAAVKAGIIKKGCPVVMSLQGEEVVKVVRKAAKKNNSELVIAGNGKIAERKKIDTYREKQGIVDIGNNKIEKKDLVESPEKRIRKDFATNFEYTASNNETYYVNLKMMGTYQAINAATAVEVALALEKQGMHTEKYMIPGLENAVWPGRMEIISDSPLIVIDGAHNPGAVGELRKSIDLYFTNRRITFIMGVLADKDFSREAEIIADRADYIITITPKNVRALDGGKLAETLRRYHKNVQFVDGFEDAVRLAEETIKKNQSDMILAFGSLSFLGDLKYIVKNKANS